MEKKIIAMCQLHNFGGIAVYAIEYGIEDKIKFAWCNGDKFGRTSIAKIKYNAKGEPYFISCKKRYYLNEFIKSEVY